MSECSYLKLYAARSRSDMKRSGIELSWAEFKASVRAMPA